MVITVAYQEEDFRKISVMVINRHLNKHFNYEEP